MKTIDFNELDRKVFDDGLVIDKDTALKYLEHCITLELNENFYEAKFTVEESLPTIEELMKWYEQLRSMDRISEVKFTECPMSASGLMMSCK